MNQQDLRAILIKIQDHLSDNDRKRLNFLLSDNLSGILRDDLMQSHTDPDKISQQDITYLMKIFEENQCNEAVKFLKENINQTQSTLPLVIIQDDEKSAMQSLLTDQKICCDNNNMLINSNNTNISPVTVVLGSQSKFSLKSKRRHLFNSSSITQKCLLLFIILSIILAGLVIISFIKIRHLKKNYIGTEQMKNDEMMERLTKLELNVNQTIQHLANKVEHLNTEPRKMNVFSVEATKDSIGNTCSCDSWCRKRGHEKGGICGDGYTCICSK